MSLEDDNHVFSLVDMFNKTMAARNCHIITKVENKLDVTITATFNDRTIFKYTFPASWCSVHGPSQRTVLATLSRTTNNLPRSIIR